MERREFEGFGGLRIVADAFGSPEAPRLSFSCTRAGRRRNSGTDLPQALAEAGRYAICVDLRGHGESGHAADGRYDLDAQVQDLRAVLSALPSRALVVAAGLGGIIALATVGESAPHLVSGLALVDVNIWFEEAELKRLHAALIERTTRVETSDQIVNALCRRTSRRACAGRPAAPAHRLHPAAGWPTRMARRSQSAGKHRPIRPAGAAWRGCRADQPRQSC